MKFIFVSWIVTWKLPGSYLAIRLSRILQSGGNVSCNFLVSYLERIWLSPIAKFPCLVSRNLAESYRGIWPVVSCNVAQSYSQIWLSRIVEFGRIVSRNVAQSYRAISLNRVVNLAESYRALKLSRVGASGWLVSWNFAASYREISLSRIAKVGLVVS